MGNKILYSSLETLDDDEDNDSLNYDSDGLSEIDIIIERYNKEKAILDKNKRHIVSMLRKSNVNLNDVKTFINETYLYNLKDVKKLENKHRNVLNKYKHKYLNVLLELTKNLEEELNNDHDIDTKNMDSIIENDTVLAEAESILHLETDDNGLNVDDILKSLMSEMNIKDIENLPEAPTHKIENKIGEMYEIKLEES